AAGPGWRHCAGETSFRPRLSRLPSSLPASSATFLLSPYGRAKRPRQGTAVEERALHTVSTCNPAGTSAILPLHIFRPRPGLQGNAAPASGVLAVESGTVPCALLSSGPIF